MYDIQELHLSSFLSSIFTSSIFSLHSPANLFTNLFLHLQFSQSKYSPTSHALSHSQLLGFQAYLLSHAPLPINSLHSHQHLSLFIITNNCI